MLFNKNVSFILSTGRTGTMFFQDYINGTCKNFRCIHEPTPSRRFIFLSNLYQANKISSKVFYDIYQKSRKKLFSTIEDENYIESSNFMSGGVFALNHHINDIKILHIVRHPQTYVKSHLDYGYWKGYKQIVRRFVPYSVENLPLSIKQRQDPIMVLYSRWKQVNNMIEKYKASNNYLLVRFEDVFKADDETKLSKLSEISNFFGSEVLTSTELLKWVKNPKNTSKKKNTDSLINNYKWYLEEYLLNDMKKYNYEL